MKLSLNDFNSQQKVKLPYSKPENIAQIKNNIVISHDNYEQLGISILNMKSLKLLDAFRPNIKKFDGFISSDVDENKFYALIRTEEGKRKVIIINLETKKIENSIIVECKKDILAYNIKIIN